MLPPTLHFAAAAAVSGLLVALARWQGRYALWLAAAGVATAGSACVLVAAYPYREVAPIGLGLFVTAPVLLAAAAARVGRRWPWPATWVAATFASATTGPPAYLLGCVVSEWFPVPGCFF